MNEQFMDIPWAEAIPAPSDLLYVKLTTYVVVAPADEPDKTYLYSDKATSSIIVIVFGQNAAGKRLVSLAHLDSADSIASYFNDVLDKHFTGYVSLYAQGANPSDDAIAIENARALYKNVGMERSWEVDNLELFLLQGDPRMANRGNFGIDLSDPQNYVVSNQPFDHELLDHAPTDRIGTAQASPDIPNDPNRAYTFIINLMDQDTTLTAPLSPTMKHPDSRARLTSRAVM